MQLLHVVKTPAHVRDAPARFLDLLRAFRERHRALKHGGVGGEILNLRVGVRTPGNLDVGLRIVVREVGDQALPALGVLEPIILGMHDDNYQLIGKDQREPSILIRKLRPWRSGDADRANPLARMGHQSGNRLVFGYEKRIAASSESWSR